MLQQAVSYCRSQLKVTALTPRPCVSGGEGAVSAAAGRQLLPLPAEGHSAGPAGQGPGTAAGTRPAPSVWLPATRPGGGVRTIRPAYDRFGLLCSDFSHLVSDALMPLRNFALSRAHTMPFGRDIRRRPSDFPRKTSDFPPQRRPKRGPYHRTRCRMLSASPDADGGKKTEQDLLLFPRGRHGHCAICEAATN